MATQDFSTYTETDPSSHITITSVSKINFTNLSRNETAYVYKDFTANYFSGNFSHNLDVYYQQESAYYAKVNIWGLGNSVNEGNNVNPEISIFFYYADSGKRYIYLSETGYNTSYEISTSTVYYLTVRRDTSVGTYGTLYLDIYNNSDRVAEHKLTTLSLTLHSGVGNTQFRYLYAVQSFNDSEAQNLTGYVENFDLGAEIIAYTMTTQVGAFTLTGNNINIYKGWKMITQVGAFTLTGVNVGLYKGWRMITQVGQFILTGIDVVMSINTKWKNNTKNLITPINLDKSSSSSFTNETKHSSTITNQHKN